MRRARFADSSLTPTKPKSIFFSTYATLTAMAREASNATLGSATIRSVKLHFPPLGSLLMILANLVVVLVLCFYKLNTTDQWSWETVGYRTGFIAIAQMPLVILLSSKVNIIGLLTGSSHERLNWLHRWVARTLWLTATIHMGFWFRSWGRYDYITVKLTADPLTQRGFAAWCILTFIVLVSVAPVRKLSYEIFLVGHLLTFAGFIAALWYHAPDEVKEWVWIPVGLVVVDRIARFALVLHGNLSIFHPCVDDSPSRDLWANHATFTPLPGNVTRITVPNPVISWKPGQHVFMSCHGLVPLQSHPLSIASIPTDKKLEFLVRAQNGATGKFFAHASKCLRTVDNRDDSSDSVKRVGVEGPYGRIRPLRQFDSVVLLAGGMGATYTMPLMRDIVEGWKNEFLEKSSPRTLPLFSSPSRSLTKRIRFVWVIRSRSRLSWFAEQIQVALQDIDACRQSNPAFDRDLQFSIYVTCDEEMSSTTTSKSQSLPLAQPQLAISILEKSDGVKKKVQEKSIETISIDSATKTERSDSQTAAQTCQPDSGCCCTRKVMDENSSFPPCRCSGPSSTPSKQPIPQGNPTHTSNSLPPSPQTSQTPPPLEHGPQTPTTQNHLSNPVPNSELDLDPRIRILSGRPDSRGIIRKVLELGEGESSVVVCGPRGLNAAVRRIVVSLSDERAVHKGTGAQGIYLHVENFEI
ncbi:hypothetical protein PAAG_04493 [Paracoccidioides lutzii Pb01]|uniref:ferric-chelate reductase (NADPH) n=1 Tax=Paracoccidioides lutzii (strain ATCC MYA-826 / Pb01) TaxID=502779 RepID=C1H149_PARBA|nr:hypothetical protein PAAG_04493 [Paracoccidioides lutzii Pb01]EEH33443.1 hypothetical protein PAAG_04493 [Paracoccidioides lutzii Pb01]